MTAMIAELNASGIKYTTRQLQQVSGGRNAAGGSLGIEKFVFRVMFIIWPGTSCFDRRRLKECGLVPNMHRTLSIYIVCRRHMDVGIPTVKSRLGIGTKACLAVYY